MIKSDYLLVRDSIHQNDSIESIIDINNNYYRRYDNLLSTNPISYKINVIDPITQRLFHPVNKYISSTMLEYNLTNLTVVLLRDKPRVLHYKEFIIKSAIITYEDDTL